MNCCQILLSWATIALVGQGAAQRRDPKPDSTFDEVVRKLETRSAENQGDAIAVRLRAAIDPRYPLARGGHLVYRKSIVWFLETSAPVAPVVRLSDGKKHALSRLGTTNLWARAWTIAGNAYETKYQFVAGANAFGGGQVRVEHFPIGPDSMPQAGVPQGVLRKMPPWTSRIYPGTVRDWWIYLPARLEKGDGACLMVFQDGKNYAAGEGNVCTVFDNLIHRRLLPPIVGVFINPGVDAGLDGKSKRPPAVSRSEEYDTCTPKYASYLEKEILPEVDKIVRLSTDPKRRAICGISSGGSCAFTAAWHRPDLFSRVLSHVGSFCDFRQLESFPKLDGSNPPRLDNYRTWQVAHNYPALIRKTPRKPLRIFLQDGSQDLNNSHGSWPLANQQMAAALQFAGYPYQFVYADGFHSLNHGKAIMPQALTWLWSDL